MQSVDEKYCGGVIGHVGLLIVSFAQHIGFSEYSRFIPTPSEDKIIMVHPIFEQLQLV